MEHHTKTMAHKWERHYPTTKTTISVAMVVIGACFIVSLVIAWPQKFSSDVFNSRLLYHTIIDIEDYFTCSPDYQKFVIDEPSQEDRLVSMYLFNVTNTRDTIEQGYKPTVEEVGPFGYRKHTYKYDISFETSDSLNVTFKEYTLLKEVTDLFSCQRMFFKLDRSFAQTFSNPCENDRCICKSHDAVLTAVNPLYLKLFWSETPHTILSYYSQVVMKTVLDSMENGFVKAARAHLLPNAMEEIMMFRQQMQSGTLLKEIFSNLYVNYSMSEVSSKILNGDVSFPKLTTCGLEKFGLSTCTLSFGERFNFLRELAINKHNLNASTFHLPSSIIPIIDPTSEISIVNTDFGIPMWAALCKFQGIVEFNGGIGYTMITSEEMKIAYDRFIRTLAAYDANIDPKDVTQEQYLASEVIINGISFHLAYYYINGQKAKLLELTYDEYNTQYTPVTCSPMGIKCIWQWGFMMKYYGATLNLGPKLSFSLVDTGSKVNTNPNNVLFPGNSARYYNVFTFCHRYGNSMNYIQSDSECPATDISYTYDDSLIFQPAGLWGAEFGINGVNKTFLRWSFSRQSKSVKEQYFSVACNVSTLLHKVYREETPFHDEYVIRYINKFKDPALNHTFVVGQWEDLGYAQWGGGYITQAIVGVRSMYQVVRDGMWIFGRKDYWNKLYEFSTWAARNGFPNAYLTNVKDSKLLMYTLASDDAAGIKFRAHMIYRATTWIGNGNDFINFVGKVGEVAFIDEATNADFNCDSESTSKACELLATTIYSSADNCNIGELFYFT